MTYTYEARGRQVFKVETGREDQQVSVAPDAKVARRWADEYNANRQDSSAWSDCATCGGIKGMGGGGRCDCDD